MRRRRLDLSATQPSNKSCRGACHRLCTPISSVCRPPNASDFSACTAPRPLQRDAALFTYRHSRAEHAFMGLARQPSARHRQARQVHRRHCLGARHRRPAGQRAPPCDLLRRQPGCWRAAAGAAAVGRGVTGAAPRPHRAGCCRICRVHWAARRRAAAAARCRLRVGQLLPQCRIVGLQCLYASLQPPLGLCRCRLLQAHKRSVSVLMKRLAMQSQWEASHLTTPAPPPPP